MLLHTKKVWKYIWRYLPAEAVQREGTGVTDTSMTRLAFLEKLNEWNRHASEAPIHYVYWEA